jgi:transcriptional regulator with XRE-family HTH domain
MTTAEKATSPRMPTLQEFAFCIKFFRELRKWSQEQLADISGLTARTIQRVEKGEPSSTDTRRALARAFGLEDIDAFNKPISIPDAEEQKAQQEQFAKDNIMLKAQPLTTGKQLAKLAETTPSSFTARAPSCTGLMRQTIRSRRAVGSMESSVAATRM